MVFFGRKKKSISNLLEISDLFSSGAPPPITAPPPNPKAGEAKNWDKMLLRKGKNNAFPPRSLKSLADGVSCKIMQMSRILQIMTFQPARSTGPSVQPLHSLFCHVLLSG